MIFKIMFLKSGKVYVRGHSCNLVMAKLSIKLFILLPHLFRIYKNCFIMTGLHEHPLYNTYF